MRHYSNWIKAYIEWASIGEAPLSFIFWTAVSTIAGALRRQVWIEQVHFQWVPNFYIVLVAPPGVAAKSTTTDVGMRLLRQIDSIRFGPNIVTWPALIKGLEEACQMVPLPNSEEYITMSAITIASSEFGTFLDPRNKDMIDVLVDLWDGKAGKYNKVTKHSGSDSVVNPWINMIACTTPSWISGNFPEYLIGGGFTSRCIFVYEDKKRRFVPWVDEAAPPDHLEKELMLVRDLEEISRLVGEYKLSPEAREWGREWYPTMWQTSTRDTSYIARKQTHTMKLAMVLSAAKSNDLVITRESCEEAEAMLSAIEATRMQVFDRIGQTSITRGASEIVEKLRARGMTSIADLYRDGFFRNLSFRDFESALQSAESTGIIQRVQLDGKTFFQVRA